MPGSCAQNVLCVLIGEMARRWRFLLGINAHMENSKLTQIVRLQGVAIIVLFVALGISIFYDFSPTEEQERILIGAPIPTSTDRVRDDIAKVEAAYGDWFPPEANFLENYKKVNNSTNGIMIQHERDYDKLLIRPPTERFVNDSTGVTLLERKDRVPAGSLLYRKLIAGSMPSVLNMKC